MRIARSILVAVIAGSAGAAFADAALPAAAPPRLEALTGAQAGAGRNMVTTPSGLRYVDLRTGTGPMPRRGQRVTAHYIGYFPDGRRFDSSVARGQPFTFTIGMGQTIAGWEEGLSTMRAGGIRKLLIPWQLGYGERGTGGIIPPRAELDFVVQLLSIESPNSP